MEVVLNGYKIIRDGTIVLNPKDTLSFTIEGLKFNFVFIEDESGNKKIEDVREPDSLTLKIFNFNNVLGTGLSDPIELATLDSGEYLYLQFAVYQIVKEIKVFHYTWSTKKKEGENSHE